MSYPPPPQYEAAPSDRPITQHPDDATMNAVMKDFDDHFNSNLSKFNISFNAIGVRNLVTYIRRKQLTDNIEVLAYNILARTFYAVVALLEVEHRLRRCMPYSAHEIEFDLSANPPTNIAHWLQRFIITVTATSPNRVNRPRKRDSLDGRGFLALGRLGSGPELPPFPLTRAPDRPNAFVPHPPPPTTVTAIDGGLSVLDERAMQNVSHSLWIDRFIQERIRSDGQVVRWQWAGSRKSELPYSSQLTRRQHPIDVAWPPMDPHEGPGILIEFKPLRLHPQPRASASTAAGGAEPPNVFAQPQ